MESDKRCHSVAIGSKAMPRHSDYRYSIIPFHLLFVLLERD